MRTQPLPWCHLNIGTVLLLPVILFRRAYSLHYLAQFGREFDVFAPEGRPASGVAGG